MDRIHKRVKVFIHSYNTTAIKEVESGALAEFGGLQKKVERGEWITSTPVWDVRNRTKTDWEKGKAAEEAGEAQSSTTESIHSCG